MKLMTREDAILTMLDGKQITSDEFMYPDDAYCEYNKTIQNEIPFRYIYNNINTNMDSLWNIKHWRLRKYIPKDKELIWCWDNVDTAYTTLRYYDSKNSRTFTFCGGRNGSFYDNYAPFDGTPPPNMCCVDELED